MTNLFISHISEDKAVAATVKLMLKELFNDLTVFVSSDYESIRSGKDWHGAIIDALKSSGAVIVLCHAASVDRPWINYEAGIGDGTGALVLPLTIRGFAKGDVSLPLSRKQARDSSDTDDVKALVRDIGEHLKTPVVNVDLQPFLEMIRAVPPLRPASKVVAQPFIERRRTSTDRGTNDQLRFRVINSGDEEVDLVHFRVSFPHHTSASDWFMPFSPPVLISEKREDGKGGTDIVITYHVTDAPLQHGSNTQRIPRLLVGGHRIDLPDLRVPLNHEMTKERLDAIIEYELAIRGSRLQKQSVRLGDIN